MYTRPSGTTFLSDPSNIGGEKVSRTSFRSPEVGLRLRFFRAAGGLFGGCADMMEETIQGRSLIQLESVAGHGFIVGKQPNAVGMKSPGPGVAADGDRGCW